MGKDCYFLPFVPTTDHLLPTENKFHDAFGFGDSTICPFICLTPAKIHLIGLKNTNCSIRFFVFKSIECVVADGKLYGLHKTINNSWTNK